MLAARPTLDVAVIMRRELLDNRWQPWRWTLEDVVPAEPAFGMEPRLLREDAQEQRWLFPGLQVELFRDDAEGYHLNLTSPAPCWFVHWRLDEGPGADGLELARPVDVSLSYHDAGRWLDAQENVDQVPAPESIREWAQAFVDVHYAPEPKRRRRPDSFRPLTDRFGNPASVSTDKGKRGGGGGAGSPMAEADGFFSRWSRRKQQTRETGQPLPDVAGSEVRDRVAPAPAAEQPVPAPAPPAAVPAPTLDDVQALHAESDFAPFVARSVAPQVRNAAMRKLFTDPHFNVMDGLDVYIEDYSLPDPLPPDMLQQMVSARSLGLVTDPEPPAAGPDGKAALPPKSDCDAGADGAADAPHGADVAQSDLCKAIPSQPAPDVAAPPSGDVADLARASRSTDVQDADMRLQPDHAARFPGAGRGAT